MTHDDVKNTCGGCHQWGCNPVIIEGMCRDCGRTEEEIKLAHGREFFSHSDLSSMRGFIYDA